MRQITITLTEAQAVALFQMVNCAWDDGRYADNRVANRRAYTAVVDKVTEAAAKAFQ